MPQPIIDPEKVRAWASSVRSVFDSGPGNVGTWLAVGITIAVAVLVVVASLRAARRQPRDAMDELQKLIDAQAGPKAFDNPPLRPEEHAKTNGPASLFGPPQARASASFHARRN